MEVDFIHMQMAFLFSILWGMCCTLTESGKMKFDPFFRNLVSLMSTLSITLQDFPNIQIHFRSMV